MPMQTFVVSLAEVSAPCHVLTKAAAETRKVPDVPRGAEVVAAQIP
jgi:hypothetical protein